MDKFNFVTQPFPPFIYVVIHRDLILNKHKCLPQQCPLTTLLLCSLQPRSYNLRVPLALWTHWCLTFNTPQIMIINITLLYLPLVHSKLLEALHWYGNHQSSKPDLGSSHSANNDDKVCR